MSSGSHVRRAGVTEVVLVPMLAASEDHVERLLAENARLRGLLEKYGQHTSDCSAVNSDCYRCTPPCDCGWADVGWAAPEGDVK